MVTKTSRPTNGKRKRTLDSEVETSNSPKRRQHVKTTSMQDESDNITLSAKIILVCLSLLRLVICFAPQFGYIHPDEFFQSPEEVARRIFDIKTQPVWEFSTDKPIRFMLIPYMLSGLSFKIISLFQVVPSAYLMLIGPRVAYTSLSFLIDFSIYKLCRYAGKYKSSCVGISMIFQTSFITLAFLTRAFSNSIEMLLLALLLLVISKDLKNYQVPRYAEFKSKEGVKYNLILLGFILMLGIWNRPTFVIFALVPMLYWTWFSFEKNNLQVVRMAFRYLVPIAFTALVSGMFFCMFYTIYYQGWDPIINTVDFISRLDLQQSLKSMSKWTVTPVNFILFNARSDNLEQFGLHPWYFASFVCFPAAFNLLAILFYVTIVDKVLGTSSYVSMEPGDNHIIMKMLSNTVIGSILMISPAPHQEFRFLIPLLVPLVILHAKEIYKSRKLFYLWLITNIGFNYFYSTIHEASVMKAALDLDPIIRSHLSKSHELVPRILHITKSDTYIIPTYQWSVPSNDETIRFNLLDDRTNLEKSFNSIIQDKEEHPGHEVNVYILLPKIRVPKLMAMIKDRVAKITILRTYSPHFGHEWLIDSLKYIKTHGGDKWRDAFGVSLVKIDV